MTYRACITATVLLFILHACKKDTDNHITGKRLIKVINQGMDSSAYTFFTYDNKGRIITVVDSASANRNLWHFNYYYNEKDQLSTIVSKERDNPFFTRDSFVYDQNQRIIQRYSNYGQGIYTKHNLLFYDNKGQLVLDSVFYSGTINEVVAFTYDHMGNVIKEQRHYPNHSSIPIEIRQATYTYTPNPFRSVAILNYLINYGGSTAFSQFNVSQLKYRDGSRTTYNYTYQNGLLSTVTETYIDRYQEESTHQTHFFYE